MKLRRFFQREGKKAKVIRGKKATRGQLSGGQFSPANRRERAKTVALDLTIRGEKKEFHKGGVFKRSQKLVGGGPRSGSAAAGKS